MISDFQRGFEKGVTSGKYEAGMYARGQLLEGTPVGTTEIKLGYLSKTEDGQRLSYDELAARIGYIIWINYESPYAEKLVMQGIEERNGILIATVPKTVLIHASGSWITLLKPDSYIDNK